MSPSPEDPRKPGAKWETYRPTFWRRTLEAMKLRDAKEGFDWFLRTFFGYVRSKHRPPGTSTLGSRPPDVAPTLRQFARVVFGVRPGAAVGEDFRHGRWRWVALVMLGVAVLGGVAWKGRDAYHVWHRRQLARQAREAVARKDYRAAVLTAHNLLAGDPKNVEAYRIVADAAELAGSRDALWWRFRVASLEPGSVSNTFALAATALRLRDSEAAAKALGTVPAEARKSEAFQALAASLAASVGQLAAAAQHLDEANRLNPTNRLHQFNLACVQLESTNAAVLATARQTMSAMRGEERFRLAAIRALLADSMRVKDRPRSVALVKDLKEDRAATLGDRLVCLEAMRRMRSTETATFFEEIKKSASGRASDTAIVLSWLNARGMARVALAWAATFPSTLASQVPVPLAVAESRESLKDWAGLVRTLATSKWDSMEYARFAMLARAERQMGNAAASKVHWQLALTNAHGQLEAMEMLARLAGQWKWGPEREEALWALARLPSTPRWPLQALHHEYQTRGDSRGLLKVLEKILERDPSDTAAQNNAVMLRLLLGADTDKASRQARELWEKSPRSPPLVSTQAFALHLAGRTKEAVALMETLPAAELRRPASAAYHGIFLVAAGQGERARPFLDAAMDASLLPEEKALVAAARRKAGLP